MSTASSSSHRYDGCSIGLASLHRKELILRRPLRVGLGLNLQLATSVNTDQFGNFSGDIARARDAASTCQLKAEAALQALGLDLGIASEGSFGPHPAVPLLPVGHEWMTFVDQREGLVISEQLISRVTNYSSCQGADAPSIAGWLQQVGFPRHRLMVRPLVTAGEPTPPWLAKGVGSVETLSAAMAEAVQRSPLAQAWLETDMRAHCNPTRQVAIRQLAFRLVRRIGQACPACEAPGWGVVGTVVGLPCASCGLATGLVQRELLGCTVCGLRQDRRRRDGRRAADPLHCAYCNP